METFDWLTVARAEAEWRKLNLSHCKHWDVYGEYDPELVDIPNPLHAFDGIFQLATNPVKWFRPTHPLSVDPTLVLKNLQIFTRNEMVVTKSLLLMPRMNAWSLWSPDDMFRVIPHSLEGNSPKRIEEDLENARELVIKVECRKYYPASSSTSAKIITETADPRKEMDKALAGPEIHFHSLCGVFRRMKHDFDGDRTHHLAIWENYITYIGGHTACFLSEAEYKFCEPHTKGFVVEAANLAYMRGIYDQMRVAIPHTHAVELIFDFLNLAWSLPQIRKYT